jgi:hypothetical protein
MLICFRSIFIAIIGTIIVSCAVSPYKDKIVTIETRPGVSQSFALLEPIGKPKGVILMFPGHKGVIHLEQDGEQVAIENEHGGLTGRPIARNLLREQGFVVALLASPTDYKYGMDSEFRMSINHTTDINHVLDYLVKRYNKKPFLHGHCRSSYSPASVITDLKNKNVSGLILSSTRSRGRHGSVTDLQKGIVTVPVLLIQHKNDPCPGTPYENFHTVVEFYESSSMKVDVIEVTGGYVSKRSKKKKGRCSGGAHGFKGLEDKVAIAIGQWLENKPFPNNIDAPEY